MNNDDTSKADVGPDLCHALAKKTGKNLVPSHHLKLAAVKRGLRGNVASTYADLVYWMQHAKHEFKGRLGIWTTGPELAKKLGIDDRTANRHVNLLAKQGLLRKSIGPAPAHLLRVTWVFPTEATIEFVHFAREIANGKPVSFNWPSEID
jgi:hypothetical protein